MADELSAEDMQRINDAIFSGQKIEAVRLYRGATGCSLVEAKEFVDQLGGATGGGASGQVHC